MKVIVITGASRGIGKAAAIACARRGWGVVLTYNSHPAGAVAALGEIEAEGGKAVALPLDVSRPDSFPAFRAALEQGLSDTWGRAGIDGLVNNAGIGGAVPFDRATDADFDKFLNVHLKGPYFLTQTLLPLLGEGSSIVNVSSATTRVATAGYSIYASMKGGLEVLTRYLAVELGARKIRVNTLSPGATLTDLGGGLGNYPDAVKFMASQTALGRVGEPEDVGTAIAALLSDDCGWVNAQNVEVAGGYRI